MNHPGIHDTLKRKISTSKKKVFRLLNGEKKICGNFVSIFILIISNGFELLDIIVKVEFFHIQTFISHLFVYNLGYARLFRSISLSKV